MFFKQKKKSRGNGGKLTLRLVNEDASFAFVESYKSLRTNLEFIAASKHYNTFAITSAGPMDGKSTVAMNLALTLGESGKRVILVDADLRKASIAHYIGISSRANGITSVLSGESELEDVIVKWPDKPVDVLTVGMIPTNPSELVGSSGMVKILEKLSQTYDYVLVDTPPVAVVTDAAIVSRIVDGVILVARSEETTKQALKNSKRVLDDVNAHIIGVVLNDYNASNHGRKDNYYYSYSYKSYGNDDK